MQAISLDRKMLIIFRVDPFWFPQPEQKKLSHLHEIPGLPSVRGLQISCDHLDCFEGEQAKSC